jgi:hypothetical protein
MGAQVAPGVTRIVGPTIMLGSGTYFDFEAPEASRLTIEDVAYGLASASRFAGQCVSSITFKRVRYTVAEHCVRMSFEVEDDPEAEPGDALDALMHELGEPTCGDMTGPLKSMCPDFKAIEKRCEAAALVQFGITMRDPALIKRHDLRMLATEKRDLMPAAAAHSWSWVAGHEPYDWEIVSPWEFDEAAERFIARYEQLTG